MDGFMLAGMLPMLRQLITPEMLDSVSVQIADKLRDNGIHRIDAVRLRDADVTDSIVVYDPHDFIKMVLYLMVAEFNGEEPDDSGL